MKVRSDAAPIRLAQHCAVRTERHLDTVALCLFGEFDLASEDSFGSELGRVIDTQTATVVLDLRGLTFMDSTGLRMLVSLDRLSRSEDFELAILCTDGPVRRVLRETGLDGVLPLSDPAGAVAATGSPV